MQTKNRRIVNLNDAVTEMGSNRSKKTVFYLLPQKKRAIRKREAYLKTIADKDQNWFDGGIHLKNGTKLAWSVAPKQEGYLGLKRVIFDHCNTDFFLLFHKSIAPQSLMMFLEIVNRKERKILRSLGVDHLDLRLPLEPRETTREFLINKLLPN